MMGAVFENDKMFLDGWREVPLHIVGLCGSHLMIYCSPQKARNMPELLRIKDLFSKLSEDLGICFETQFIHNCSTRISESSFTRKLTVDSPRQ